MKIKKKVTILFMVMLTAVFALNLAHADGYYSLTDPGKTKPPAPPWRPASAFSLPATEVEVWVAEINEVAVGNKFYTLDIYTDCPMELIVEEVRGYFDSPHGGQMESTIAAVTKNEVVGNRHTITALFHPSPDWEVVKLLKNLPGGGSVSMAVNQDSCCVSQLTLVEDPDPTPGNYRLTISEGWFGPLGGGGGMGLLINRIEVFDRVDKWIKPFFQPEYGPPWMDELITDGMDVIGVRFVAPKGEFLETGERYNLYYTATSMPDLFLDCYAHDTSFGRDIYINMLARPVGHPLLGAKKPTLSAGTGGSIEFKICAGPEHANKSYVLLGGVTGTAPGTALPGGMAVLPLNWDAFTDLVLMNINSPVFDKFLGKIDPSHLPGPVINSPSLDPSLAGLKMFFAYTFYNPFDLASNQVETMIVP